MSDGLVVLQYKQEADTRIGDDSTDEPCSVAMMRTIIDNIVAGHEEGLNNEFDNVMHLIKTINNIIGENDGTGGNEETDGGATAKKVDIIQRRFKSCLVR